MARAVDWGVVVFVFTVVERAYSRQIVVVDIVFLDAFRFSTAATPWRLIVVGARGAGSAFLAWLRLATATAAAFARTIAGFLARLVFAGAFAAVGALQLQNGIVEVGKFQQFLSLVPFAGRFRRGLLVAGRTLAIATSAAAATATAFGALAPLAFGIGSALRAAGALGFPFVVEGLKVDQFVVQVVRAGVVDGKVARPARADWVGWLRLLARGPLRPPTALRPLTAAAFTVPRTIRTLGAFGPLRAFAAARRLGGGRRRGWRRSRGRTRGHGLRRRRGQIEGFSYLAPVGRSLGRRRGCRALAGWRGHARSRGGLRGLGRGGGIDPEIAQQTVPVIGVGAIRHTCLTRFLLRPA